MEDGSGFEMYLYRLLIELGYSGVYKTIGSRDFGNIQKVAGNASHSVELLRMRWRYCQLLSLDGMYGIGSSWLKRFPE